MSCHTPDRDALWHTLADAEAAFDAALAASPSITTAPLPYEPARAHALRLRTLRREAVKPQADAVEAAFRAIERRAYETRHGREACPHAYEALCSAFGTLYQVRIRARCGESTFATSWST